VLFAHFKKPQLRPASNDTLRDIHPTLQQSFAFRAKMMFNICKKIVVRIIIETHYLDLRELNKLKNK